MTKKQAVEGRTPKSAAINARIPRDLEKRLDAVVAAYPSVADKSQIVNTALRLLIDTIEERGEYIVAETFEGYGKAPLKKKGKPLRRTRATHRPRVEGQDPSAQTAVGP